MKWLKRVRESRKTHAYVGTGTDITDKSPLEPPSVGFVSTPRAIHAEFQGKADKRSEAQPKVTHRGLEISAIGPTDRTDRSQGLEDQYPEDQERWREAKRVFGDAFPPAQDPLAGYEPTPETVEQRSSIERFREDERHILALVRGEVEPDVKAMMPIPHPSRIAAYAGDRQASERHQRATAAIAGDRPLSVPLGYEGPGTGQRRRFMTRNGFVIEVPMGAYLAHDSTRLLIAATREGQDALAYLKNASIEFPGVHQEPGLITVRCEPGYHPEVTLWSRRLVLDLERQGMRFDASASELIVTHDGDALDDQTLGQVLPRTEIIKSTILERRTA